MDEPDVLYFDTITCNLASPSAGGIPPTAYNQARTIPYLTNPSDYYGAVMSLSVNDSSIPVITPDIVPYQSDPNLTIYNVTLTYSGSIATSPIIFQTQNLNAEVPLGPSGYPAGVPNYSTGYYNIYNYNFFMGLVNTAFATCYTALKVLQPTLPANRQPVITFDSVTSFFTIKGANSLYNEDTLESPILIYMNGPLYHLFGFTNLYTTLNGLSENQILMNANTAFVDLTNDLIFATQQNNSVSLWNNITDIVITSTYMPSTQVLVGNPQIVYQGQSYPISTNNSLTRQILLDFPYRPDLYKVPIVYIPTAQYQVFDMNSSDALYNLDWQMWYRARTGLLYPLYLNSGTSCSLKLGFFKKSAFTHLKGLR
jgi:hypothetical protein